MAIPYYTHSGMAGAPQFSTAARSTPDVLAAVLVNGFNVQAPTSAVASGGVLTLNYGSAHGYEALCHITVSGASVAGANGTWRVATVPAGNQLTCYIAGLPDGAVGGTISTKVAPAGWTEPLAPGPESRVFAQAAPSTGHWLWITNPAGSICYAVGYKSMTDLSTGVGRFPATDSVYPTSSSASAADNWAVVATGKFFYLSMKKPGFYSLGYMCFGDLAEPVKPGDQYHCILNGMSLVGAVARDYEGLIPGQNYIASLGAGTSPSPIDQYRFLFGVPTYSSAVAGVLPGAANCLPRFPVYAGSEALIENAAAVSGRLLPLVRPYENEASIAVSLDEDWGA